MFSGIDFDHPDFGGRIDKSKSADFIDSNGDGTDYNGHGTHCAGTCLQVSLETGTKSANDYHAQKFHSWLQLTYLSFFFLSLGTVLADTYGLAKKATGVAVRVLNANGSGTFE